MTMFGINIQWFDVVGLFGVLLTVFAYLALQARRMKGDGYVFPFLNLIGASAILCPLIWGEFNLAPFVIEAAWICISIYGLYKAATHKPVVPLP
jgi:paired small multidrug resistance pump